jgi:hypothetical protein
MRKWKKKKEKKIKKEKEIKYKIWGLPRPLFETYLIGFPFSP